MESTQTRVDKYPFVPFFVLKQLSSLATLINFKLSSLSRIIPGICHVVCFIGCQVPVNNAISVSIAHPSGSKCDFRSKVGGGGQEMIDFLGR